MYQEQLELMSEAYVPSFKCNSGEAQGYSCGKFAVALRVVS